MINIIVGSFIGATLSSIMMTGIKFFAIKRIMGNIKEIVAEVVKLDCTNED